MVLLGMAQFVVTFIPFERWRGSLGTNPRDADGRRAARSDVAAGRRTAAVVERAAERVPFHTKCLPRAIALSWLLRRNRLRHSVVFAARPAHIRDSADALHAWVEVDGFKILGDLPGPWLETLRLGD